MLASLVDWYKLARGKRGITVSVSMLAQVGFGCCQTAASSAEGAVCICVPRWCLCVHVYVGTCEGKQMCYDLISRPFKFQPVTA